VKAFAAKSVAEVWNKEAVTASIVLALTALPFFIEGVIFQSLYVILVGDVPLFIAATRVWRIKRARKATMAASQAPSNEQRAVLVTPRDDSRDPELLPKPLLLRDRLPILDSRSNPAVFPSPAPPSSASKLTIRLQKQKLRLRSSSKGLKKAAYLCSCGHVHVTSCMTCGMTIERARKSRRTRWTEWEVARSAGWTEEFSS